MRDDEIVGLLPLSIVIASPQTWIVCAAIPGNCSYVHPLLLSENNLILQCSSVSSSLDACSLGQLLLYFFTELSEVGCRQDSLEQGHLKKLVEDVYYFGFILLEALLGPIVSEKISFGSQDGRQRIVDLVVLTTCCHDIQTTVGLDQKPEGAS
ncbi:hypothetical protein L6452_16455 [Arctium lappa]|uniref:Uncharacterized protein n=1 Tax=Arctium lappa TaxID=4217 RepID=A0ACB9C0T8_ARCLA|nr:hypothetical protein L6452_16455 [Arctium lappa]